MAITPVRPRPRPRGGDPAADAPLTPSSRRLLAALAQMSAAERTAARNTDLAARIGTSTRHPRTVSAALAALADAGLVRVDRVASHPRAHPTGRVITVTARGARIAGRP